MTNGEKLQRIFPNMEWEVKDNTVLTDIDNGSWFSLDWWNAEYKEPTTKNDLSSGLENASPFIDWNNCHTSEQLNSLATTKNDLGVDAISRQEAIDTIRQLYLDLASQKAVIDILKVLPSVTPQEPILDRVRAEIQSLRNCSCSCSDGIIDDVEDIIDKYRTESEDT